MVDISVVNRIVTLSVESIMGDVFSQISRNFLHLFLHSASKKVKLYVLSASHINRQDYLYYDTIVVRKSDHPPNYVNSRPVFHKLFHPWQTLIYQRCMTAHHKISPYERGLLNCTWPQICIYKKSLPYKNEGIWKQKIIGYMLNRTIDYEHMCVCYNFWLRQDRLFFELSRVNIQAAMYLNIT